MQGTAAASIVASAEQIDMVLVDVDWLADAGPVPIITHKPIMTIDPKNRKSFLGRNRPSCILVPLCLRIVPTAWLRIGRWSLRSHR